jgi:hypothetical protein
MTFYDKLWERYRMMFGEQLAIGSTDDEGILEPELLFFQ